MRFPPDLHSNNLPNHAMAGSVLEYKTDEQLETKSYNNGLLPYGGGGFAIDIPLYFNKSEVRARIIVLSVVLRIQQKKLC
jgi:hypothetical protein